MARRHVPGPELIDWFVHSVQDHYWDMAWATVGFLADRTKRELTNRRLPSRPLEPDIATKAAKYRVCLFNPHISHYDLKVKQVESELLSKEKETKVLLECKREEVRYVVLVAQKGSRIQAQIDQVIKTS